MSLEEELRFLGMARDSLAQGDGRGALDALDALVRSHPRPILADEVSIVRVEALAAAGEGAAASAAARRFLAERANSPYAPRARAHIGK